MSQMAIRIADNAKTQRYSPCNTMETLLVHAGIAPAVLPPLASIYSDKGVELRGCDRSRALVPAMKEATEDDWYTEYLAPILAVRIVDSLDEAMAHIARYGSQHTDAIVTEHYGNARRFLREVDSSSVLVNASTRFADGFEFGLGAEIGISTNKLHARGPVGLEGLTSQKWVVLGSGQIRTWYYVQAARCHFARTTPPPQRRCGAARYQKTAAPIRASTGNAPMFIVDHPAADTSAPDENDDTPIVANTMKSLAPCVRAFSTGVYASVNSVVPPVYMKFQPIPTSISASTKWVNVTP